MYVVFQKPGAFLGVQESKDCFVRSICNDFPGESVSGKIEVEQINYDDVFEGLKTESSFLGQVLPFPFMSRIEHNYKFHKFYHFSFTLQDLQNLANSTSFGTLLRYTYNFCSSL